MVPWDDQQWTIVVMPKAGRFSASSGLELAKLGGAGACIVLRGVARVTAQFSDTRGDQSLLTIASRPCET